MTRSLCRFVTVRQGDAPVIQADWATSGGRYRMVLVPESRAVGPFEEQTKRVMERLVTRFDSAGEKTSAWEIVKDTHEQAGALAWLAFGAIPHPLGASGRKVVVHAVEEEDQAS